MRISRKTTWAMQELKDLHQLRKKGKSFGEIAKSIKTKTVDAISRKYSRMDWNSFLKNPEQCLESKAGQKWSSKEMAQLDAYLQSGQSYSFIAEKLGRSIVSVERQAQETDWKAWRLIKDLAPDSSKPKTEQESKEEWVEEYTKALLNVCGPHFDQIEDATEEYFLKRVNLEKDRLFLPFDELKKRAIARLVSVGHGNPESIDIGPGTYVIVGDSHGKHTQKEMFAMLQKVNETLKPKKIIHIGHILDDDNDISYDWGKFNNLTVLAKSEELSTIQEQRNKFNFTYDIVRGTICVGEDLVLMNQDLINDYVRTSLSGLSANLAEEKQAIVNCHRLEYFSRCCSEGVSYFSSPGCICEQHIVRTVKQIDFSEGKVIKQANYEGFSKYRRQKQIVKCWEQGLIIIKINEAGEYTLIHCPIKSTTKGFAIAYFDKMITSRGVFNPDNKIFVNADMHCDKHDANVLDVQEQICKDYKPNVQVNLGDTFDYASLNHHSLDRGEVIFDKKILDEAAQTHFVLRRVARWANESHIICGNHERFAKDFVAKYPQFGQYLDFEFICNLKGMGYKITPLKSVLKIGSVQFVHGELKMYGATGSKSEKSSRTFGREIFIGHVHHPEIRTGCFNIGLSGMLDQEYNEPDASNWIHGFGLCNQFGGHSFLTSIAIIDNTCVLNKTYKPIDPESWKLPADYKVQIVYNFDKEKK